MTSKEIKVEFTIDQDAFTETPTKKISNVILIVEYENPQSYGYPDVWYWSEEYNFDVDKIRSKINGKN